MKTPRLLLKLIFCALVLNPMQKAFSQTDTMDPQKNEIITHFHKIKTLLQKNEIKKRKVLSALYEINKKIKKIVFNRSRLKVDMVLIDKSIQQLKQSRASLEAEIKAEKRYLALRLRSLYRSKSASFIEYLLSAKSNSEIDRQLRLMTRLALHDREIVAQLNYNLEQLDLNKLKLEKKKKELVLTQKDSEMKEQEYSHEEKLKTMILNGVQKTQLFAKDQLEEVRQKSRVYMQDPSVVELLYKPSMSALKGQLKSPTTLELSQGFGIIDEETYQIPHRGNFYEGPANTVVTSVFEGTVRQIEDLPYFGKTVILDHGDHYYTSYSFLKNVVVKVGEIIKTGQVIAHSGFSEHGDASGLYFEVRHFSEPEDPSYWISSNDQKQVNESEQKVTVYENK